MMEQFESLTLGAAGPGQPEGVDPASLPRPVGEALERALTAHSPGDPANCSPDNMRMTINAIPVSTALKARWAAGGAGVTFMITQEVKSGGGRRGGWRQGGIDL